MHSLLFVSILIGTFSILKSTDILKIQVTENGVMARVRRLYCDVLCKVVLGCIVLY